MCQKRSTLPIPDILRLESPALWLALQASVAGDERQLIEEAADVEVGFRVFGGCQGLWV